MSQANYDSHALGCHCNQCMSNNAIWDWANQGRVDTESWGRYLERTYARPREMTAADLGIDPQSLWDRQEWEADQFIAWLDSFHSDAPYSFWLGADQ